MMTVVGNLWIGSIYSGIGLEEGRRLQFVMMLVFINAIVSSNEGVVYFATESRGCGEFPEKASLQIKDTGEKLFGIDCRTDNNLGWVLNRAMCIVILGYE